MPLEKSTSREAFEHNVKAEVDAGKPTDQAVAIAYSTKRKAARDATPAALAARAGALMSGKRVK